MITRLSLYRFPNPDTVRGMQVRHVLVPRCPMFDFDNENDTPEVRELLAQGFHIGGHVDVAEGQPE